MKKNYLKTYFKAFGFLATLLVIVLLAFAGLVVFQIGNFDFLSGYETIANVAVAGLMAVIAGGALVGVSGLRNEKVCMTDFVRITFFISSIILGVLAILAKSTGSMIAYFAFAGVFLVEIIVRCTAITNDQVEVGMKAYFSALGYRFNPILIVGCGIVVAFGLFLLGKFGILDKLLNVPKYSIAGGCIAIVAVLLISAMDKDSDANFLDFILAVCFIGLLYGTAILAEFLKGDLVVILLMLVATVTVSLATRAVCYNKDIVYDNQRHKAKTYFRNIFSRYSVLLAVFVGVVAVASATIAVLFTGDSQLKSNFNGILPEVLSNNAILIFGAVAIAIAVILLVLVFIFRGFSSTEPVKTDWALTALIITCGFGIPAIAGVAIASGFNVLIDNIIVLVALALYAVLFIIGIILQVIRIRNFDPMAAIIAAEAEQRMNEKKEAKQAAKEAEEQAAKEAEEKKPYDPFALTEEDEAIYEAEYGKEKEEEPTNPYAEEEPAQEEQPAEEAQEEEVVEEAPAEEEVVEEEAPAEEAQEEDEFAAFLNSVPDADAKEEEAPAEEAPAEETPVEEAPVEEAPAEEASEDADEEEGEEEDEDDADDEAEDEPLEEGEEEPAPLEKHKEADIQVQEFVAVDEDGTPKKIKRKFNTKMMFAPYETKEYYNEIKNYLMMYRAKGRCSSRCESFRYKGLVAKLALGGKAVKVFLALDPAIIEQYPKYHLKDVSEKKQYSEVPVLIKVRSDRALKYCKELIDLMFANRLVKPKRNFEPTNFVPQLIPNGEAILGNLGMSTYYLQNTMNVNGIPEEMPDDLIDYLPMIPGEPLEEEEEEAVAYLDTLCLHFEDGDEVTLDVLKSMHICQKGNILRIKARGTLDRKLIIYAEKFDDDALKMIMCTNGTAVRIVRETE